MRLTDKYRPESFDDVLGQDKVVKALKDLIAHDGKLPPAILLVGGPGLGKTTIARCCANVMKVKPTEFNAANKNSVDDVREILDLVSYIPFGTNKARVIILDEAQQMSKAAWSALLKGVEEPADMTTWVFCTTEGNKIPAAIRSRCSEFELNKIPASKIKAHLEIIVKEEQFVTPNNILSLIAMKCDGSPRRALKALELLHATTALQEAQELLKSIGDEEELPAVLALGRLILKGGTFQEALGIVRGIEGEWEGIRLGLLAFFTTVCNRSRNIEECKKALQVMYTFSKPWYPSEKSSPLLLCLGELLIV